MSKQEETILKKEIVVCVYMYLIVTKVVLVSACPTLSYSMCALSLDTCLYWSIRRKASISLVLRSVTPTAWIRPYTSTVYIHIFHAVRSSL